MRKKETNIFQNTPENWYCFIQNQVTILCINRLVFEAPSPKDKNCQKKVWISKLFLML